MKSSIVKEKLRQTFRCNLGVDNPSQSEEIKRKKENTNLKHWGVKNVFQNETIKKKSMDTSQKNWGVDHPMQNAEIARKCFDHMRKPKIYTFPSGREDKVQGYEPQGLNDLIHNEAWCEKDII